MRPGIVAYFDLGQSAGLTDAVLPESRRRAPRAIGMIGLNNPLGDGAIVNLVESPVLVAWRRSAVAEADRPEMELGWSAETGQNRDQFVREIKNIVANHPVMACEVTVYALGVAYLSFELDAGIPTRYVHGVLACFEYAAYTSAISDRILRATCDAALLADNNLARLTRRPRARAASDQTGRRESRLFTAFTGVYRCVDSEDQARLAEILGAVGLESSTRIVFEYHGAIYYDWADCVLWPRAEPTAPLDQEVERMRECIRIAHASLAICEALLRLTTDETRMLVESYVSKGSSRLRSAEALNQLRTFALAVVDMTRIYRVTQAAEDRSYFEKFAEDAQFDEMRQSIVESVEVLFNVQNAAAEADWARRESLLNGVVIALASLTLVSVSVDVYNFIREDQPLISDRVQRAITLVEFVVALLLLLVAIWIILWRPARIRRRRKP